MKRPIGVSFIALLYLITGFGSLAMLLMLLLAFLGVFGDSPNFSNSREIWLALMWVAFFSIVGSMFLSIGYGLWRLRAWARFLTIALAGLISVAFLADFFRWTAEVGDDVITQWESFEMACRQILLLPYHMISWPIWAGLTRLFPDSWLSVLTAQIITTYSVGVLGYGGIVRYMLSTRLEQSFSKGS